MKNLYKEAFNKIERYILEYLAAQDFEVSENAIVIKAMNHFPTLQEGGIHEVLKTLNDEGYILKNKDNELTITENGRLRKAEISFPK